MRPILLHSHTRALTKIVYNKDGDLLFSASKDHVPVVWFAHNGERLGTYHGHNGAIWSLDVSDDSTKLLTGAADNTARVWDASTGKSLSDYKVSTPVRSVDFSLGDKQIVIVTDAKMGFAARILAYELSDKKVVLDINVNGPRPTVVKWVECNRFILTAHEDGSIAKWNVATKQRELLVKVHEKSITDVQMSPEGTYFITSSKDNNAKLIDLKDFSVKKTYKTVCPVNSASISPIRDEVILGGGQEAQNVTTTLARSGKFEVRFFDAIFEEELGRVKGHFGPINTLAYRPDGRGFASGGEDGYIRLHEFDADYYEFKY